MSSNFYVLTSRCFVRRPAEILGKQLNLKEAVVGRSCTWKAVSIQMIKLWKMVGEGVYREEKRRKGLHEHGHDTGCGSTYSSLLPTRMQVP